MHVDNGITSQQNANLMRNLSRGLSYIYNHFVQLNVAQYFRPEIF